MEIRLVGLTPLLMNNAASQLGADRARSRRKSVFVPEEEAEKAAYRDSQGYLVFPTAGIRSSILKAASQLKAEGIRGRKSLAQVLSGVLFPVEEFVWVTRDGKPLKEYAVDIRRAVVQRQGVLKARARVDLPWEIRAVFALDLDRVTPGFLESIEEAANIAGRSVGIGDYRPERRGTFGRFQAELVV